MLLCTGCFDGLHIGHVRYLQAAAELAQYGEAVVVAVAGDAYIRAQKAREPRWSQADRVAVVEALRLVDRVLAEDATGTETTIVTQRPRVLVKGADWRGRLPSAVSEACLAVDTQVVYVDTPARRWPRMTDLEALESAVAAQLGAPPPGPWVPVTDYSWEARRVIDGPHARLILDHLVSCDDADVLDYGCGPGHLVRLLREGAAEDGSQVSVMGYDPVAGADWTPYGAVFPARLLREDGVWDLVICREVLEHCQTPDYLRVVARLCGLSANLVYVTTRFAAASRPLLTMETHDDLDPTHITMLHQDVLRALFVLHGFRRRADLEAVMDWRQLGRCLVYQRMARV